MPPLAARPRRRLTVLLSLQAGLIEANGELKVFIDQNLSPGKGKGTRASVSPTPRGPGPIICLACKSRAVCREPGEVEASKDVSTARGTRFLPTPGSPAHPAGTPLNAGAGTPGK